MEGDYSSYQQAACQTHGNFLFGKSSFIGWAPSSYIFFFFFLTHASLLLNDIRENHLIQDWSNRGLKRNEENEA